MSGEGGDAVLLASSSYCIDLLKQAKFSEFFQHFFGWCRLQGLPLLPRIMFATKQSLTSYSRWLQQIKRLKAENLMLPQQSLFTGMTWDLLPTIASWHSKELVQLVLEELQHWVAVATPFSKSMGEHVSIALIQLNALSARSTQQMADLYDVNLEFPYFDQLVVEACLSARPEERTSPFVFKPLMHAAFQHELPSSIYRRNTKGEYVADEFIGFRKNRETINTFFENSLLVDMELIDLKMLKMAMQDFEMGVGAWLALFSNTLATEIWLRRLTESDRIFWSNGSEIV